MSTMPAPTSSSQIAESIRSMIVLHGSVRGPELARKLDRSMLDLPLVSGTILTHQLTSARACAAKLGVKSFGIRVLLDDASTLPESHSKIEGVECSIERDAGPIRGVAGVLSDATKDYGDDEYIIVSSGAQVFIEPLGDLVRAMMKKGADVAFVSSVDGSPVGLWLIRCGVLRSVKPVGYIDLKEQALANWKSEHKVCVVERQRPYAHSVRSLTEYLGAIRAAQSRVGSGSTVDEDPYREEWESMFSVVEPGALVDDGAILHDTVVLSGATVSKGAVVVRSVLCSGARVEAGARVTDLVVDGVVKKGRSR